MADLRVPPANLDAEAAVLSACMLVPGSLDAARVVVSAADFYADANRYIFEAVCALDESGRPIDAVTVATALRVAGHLDRIGGTPYLAQILDATPGVAHVEEHAGIIRHKALQRRVIKTCQAFSADGYGEIEDARRWSQDVAQALADLADAGGEQNPAEQFGELVPRVLDDIKEKHQQGGVIPGVDIGWPQLSRMLNGLRPGKLYILAGRPGMGKSAFLLGAALNIAKRGLGVVFISAEMTKEELAERALAVEAKVDVSLVASGKFDKAAYVRVMRAAEKLRRIPLSIKHQPAATISDIRGSIRQEQRKFAQANKKIGLIVVDYIQILNGQKSKSESRENEVSDLSRRLMWMANEFDAPLLAASQLNRDVEKRPDKRPMLSDLRESGSLEQDAYGVLFLYRDAYYQRRNADEQPQGDSVDELEVIVAKHRNGETGTARLAFINVSTAITTLGMAGEEVDEYDRMGDFAEDAYGGEQY